MSGFDRRRVTDKTDMEVKATAEIMASQPHCISVLYGTHCTQAHLVPIPFIKHYHPPSENRLPPPTTIDSLFIECWMPRGMKQKWEDRITLRVPEHARSVDHLDGMGTDDDDRNYKEQENDNLVEEDAEDSESYSIFYAPQNQKRDPFSPPLEKRNAAVANIFYNEAERGRREKDIIWYGPILVVKHSTEEMGPISIEKEELERVWEVVKGALRKGLLSSN